jgi:hypothetical protein
VITKNKENESKQSLDFFYQSEEKRIYSYLKYGTNKDKTNIVYSSINYEKKHECIRSLTKERTKKTNIFVPIDDLSLL